MLRLGQAETALVIGAEVFSRILDWDDRGTCVLFGDGAGATILRAADAAGNNQDRGILSTHIHSDGAHYDTLYVDGGPSTTGTSGHLRMEGKEVFRHAVHRMSEVVETALEHNGLSINEVDWLVPHQANKRIMDSIAKRLSLPEEKIVDCRPSGEYFGSDDTFGLGGGFLRRSPEQRKPDSLVGARRGVFMGCGTPAALAYLLRAVCFRIDVPLCADYR